MVIRLILAGLLAYLVFRVFRSIVRSLQVRGSGSPAEAPGQAADVSQMARDPICGVYVSVNESIGLRHKGETVHFCSEECRKKYLGNQG